MFRLNLVGVRDQPGKPAVFNFREQLAPVEGPDGIIVFIGPVEAEVNVTCMEGQYWLNGLVRGRVELMCVRCLEPFEYPFQVTLAEKYGRGWCQDDAETVPMEGESVDITDTVVQNIIVSLPMKALCHSECRGVCPACGQMLNQASCSCRADDVDPKAKLFKPGPKGVE